MNILSIDTGISNEQISQTHKKVLFVTVKIKNKLLESFLKIEIKKKE